MKKDSKILIVGHNGIIENSLFSHLKASGYNQVFSSFALNLDPLKQDHVQVYFKTEKPEYVFLASTRSGGIGANQRNGGEFIYSNLMSQINIIHAAQQHFVKKLVFISSSCVYPKECAQPMAEEALLTGPLEPTSEPYAVAKISGIKMCQAYRKQYGLNAIVMIPATVYGPGSDTDIQTAHVLGALIAKFYKAVKDKQEEVIVWGTGQARREFLYADDFVAASLFLMDNYNDEAIIHAGWGSDVSIQQLAEMIAKISGFTGKISYDHSKPDGSPQKLLDSKRAHDLGWMPKVSIEEGIKKTYHWYADNY